MPNKYTRCVHKVYFNASVLQKAHIVSQGVSDRTSPQGSEFSAGHFYMGFVMEKVALGEGFRDYFGLVCQYHSYSAACSLNLTQTHCKVRNLEHTAALQKVTAMCSDSCSGSLEYFRALILVS